jgi:hypothetical protein
MAGQGGTGGVSACVACEQHVPFADACTPALLQTTPTSGWGCNSFTGTALANCNALLACVRGQSPAGSCRNGDDPTPCLCGTLDPNTCVTSGAPATAPCAAQYAAAAMGFPGTVFTQFFDPTTPVGIADNLLTCDVDQPCLTQCMVQ